ncbi:MAG: hypothetical protein Kow0099_13130 [Candidatus Abyssubacteria bacterium]
MQSQEASLTPEFFRDQLKCMVDVAASPELADMFGTLVGIISMMNSLQPEGYSECIPAFTFQPIKE